MSGETELVVVKLYDLIRLQESITELRNMIAVQATSDGDEIMKPAEAAAYLQISEHTIKDLAAAGRIPHRGVGRQLRFSKRALSEWIQNGGRDVVHLPRRTGSHERR